MEKKQNMISLQNIARLVLEYEIIRRGIRKSKYIKKYFVFLAIKENKESDEDIFFKRALNDLKKKQPNDEEGVSYLKLKEEIHTLRSELVEIKNLLKIKKDSENN